MPEAVAPRLNCPITTRVLSATDSETNMASLEEAFILVSSKFKIPTLNYHQKLAIDKIVLNRKDVFVNLATGFGDKSLIYQALPLVLS